MENTLTEMKKGAQFSEDRKCRYFLYRFWDNSKPVAMFIGLNPSSANENEDDPTMESVIRIAKHNGYGGVFMVNCFPVISTDPKLLIINKYYTGSIIERNNLNYLIGIKNKCKDVIFAYGNFKVVSKFNVDMELQRMFPCALCICKNKNGSPGHPLYKKANSKLIKF